VAVIVPHGVLFRGAAEGKIRKSLLEDNLIDAVIGLPAGLFQTTGIPVSILILDRSREEGGANAERKDVFFVEASREFKPGKARNFMEPEHIDKIVAAYEKREAMDRFCRPVPPEEIVENDHNLNITRYVDTFVEEDAIDIEANLKELAAIDQELAEVEVEMAEHLKALGIAKAK
jgi:type I restriction enzyme M protein